MKILSLFVFFITLFVITPFGYTQEIVYSQLTGDFWQIWVMDLETKQTRQLTDGPVDKRGPQCDASGSQLIYRTANAELFLLDLQDPKYFARPILANLGTIMDAHWSKDGTKILFTRMRTDLLDDSDIWLVDINGKNLKEITNKNLLQYHPQFIDEKNIVFVSQDPHTHGHNLWRKGLEASAKWTQLTMGPFYDLLPDVSADGQNIVFSSNRSGSFDIWRLNMPSGKLLRLTDQETLATSPSFSPDNKSILFVSAASGSKQIWFMDLDGSHQTQITDDKTQRQEPAWCHSRILKGDKP